ncbi:hypothetical protein PTKIN_Ptkin02bG0032500 [Pterospermum kingtungense]
MKNSDKISNLPDNITEQILGRMPIRDAVRTSVLSTNWRDKWTTLSDLVFDAQVSNEGFQNLIANCPKLYILNLILADGLDGLYIDYAPHLTRLVFIGSPNYICLKNTPHLAHAGIVFTQLPDMNQNIGKGLYNLNFLSNLPSFAAGSYFLKFLSQGSVRKLLPSTFENRYHVCIYELMFENIDSLSSALGLITSSPKLKIKLSRTSRSNVENSGRVFGRKMALHWFFDEIEIC